MHNTNMLKGIMKCLIKFLIEMQSHGLQWLQDMHNKDMLKGTINYLTKCLIKM